MEEGKQASEAGPSPKGTPADDPETPEPDKEEWALLRGYRRLSESERESIRLVIKNYLKE